MMDEYKIFREGQAQVFETARAIEFHMNGAITYLYK